MRVLTGGPSQVPENIFFVGSLSSVGKEGESVRKEEKRKSLRDGEVLSLLDSDGKLLLVGGLAHVESMDVKGKGGVREKEKKKRKKKHKPRPVLFTSRRKRTKHYHSHIARTPRFLWDVERWKSVARN